MVKFINRKIRDRKLLDWQQKEMGNDRHEFAYS